MKPFAGGARGGVRSVFLRANPLFCGALGIAGVDLQQWEGPPSRGKSKARLVLRSNVFAAGQTGRSRCNEVEKGGKRAVAGRLQTGRGFTLIELLAVVAIIAILAALLLPALSMVKQKSKTLNCLSNLKQLALGLTLYGYENNDRIVQNRLSDPLSWIDSSAGNVSSLPGATNVMEITRGVLFKYNPNAKIYQCPGSMTGPAGLGVKVARNYSLQGRMGGQGGYVRFAEILRPGPSAATTFVDESINSIDDGYFATQNSVLFQWQNSPTARHNNSGTFAFADGHSERWKWLGLNMEQGLAAGAKTPAQQQDWQRAFLSVFANLP
jgi:hypothetical protein